MFNEGFSFLGLKLGTTNEDRRFEDPTLIVAAYLRALSFFGADEGAPGYHVSSMIDAFHSATKSFRNSNSAGISKSAGTSNSSFRATDDRAADDRKAESVSMLL